MAEHKIFITFSYLFLFDNVAAFAVAVSVGCHAQFNAQLSTQGAFAVASVSLLVKTASPYVVLSFFFCFVLFSHFVFLVKSLCSV